MKRYATFRTDIRPKTINDLMLIIANEKLQTVKMTMGTDALGDEYCELHGETTEVKVLKELFNCIH